MDSWAESEIRKIGMRKVLAKLNDLEACQQSILANHLTEVTYRRIIVTLLTLNLVASILALVLLYQGFRTLYSTRRSDVSLLGMQLVSDKNTSVHILQISGPVGVFVVGSSGVPTAETSFSCLFSTVSALPEGLFGRLASRFQSGAATVTRGVPGLRVVELDDPLPTGAFSQVGFIQHSDTCRYQSRSIPRSENPQLSGLYQELHFKEISKTCDSRSASGRCKDQLVIPRDEARGGEGSHLDLMTTSPVKNSRILVARSHLVVGAKLTEDGFLGRIRNPKNRHEESSC
jgi:hypothetical protein